MSGEDSDGNGEGEEALRNGNHTWFPPFHPPLIAAMGPWDGEVPIGLALSGHPGLQLWTCGFKVTPTLSFLLWPGASCHMLACVRPPSALSPGSWAQAPRCPCLLPFL